MDDHKSKEILLYGFYFVCALAIVFLITTTTISNRSFDLRSKAAPLTTPVISFLRVDTLTPNSALVKWTTNIPTTTYIAWDTINTSFGNSPETWGQWRVNIDNTTSSSMILSHIAPLKNLDANTTYFLRAAGRTSPGAGTLVTSPANPIYSFKTLPMFTAQPSPFFSQLNSTTLPSYQVYFSWTTSTPTKFIEVLADEANKATISLSNPTQWVNYWGSKTNWSPQYLNTNKTYYSAYQPLWGGNYYHRIAAMDQAGKIYFSDIYTFKKDKPPAPHP